MIDLANIRKFQDLLEPGVEHPHYQFDRIFSTDGMTARSNSKKKLRVLKRIDPILNQHLYENEVVDFITTGVQSRLTESLLAGALVVYYLNRTAILLTTHRILLIRIDRRNRPRDLVFQIRYDAIAKLNRGFTGKTAAKTTDGKSVAFEGVPRSDRKHLVNVMQELQSSGTLETSGVDGIESLCPHCWEPVLGRPESCDACGGTFKTVGKAMIRSLIFPGLGDWYLGHRSFARFEMAGAAVIWFGMITDVIDLTRNGADRTAFEVIGAIVIIVALMHGFDALLTRRIARAGIYPDEPPKPVPVVVVDDP